MGAVLGLLVVMVGAAVLLPKMGFMVTRYATSALGRFAATWGIVALIYDTFATGERQFALTDAGITAGAALIIMAVL